MNEAPVRFNIEVSCRGDLDGVSIADRTMAQGRQPEAPDAMPLPAYLFGPVLATSASTEVAYALNASEQSCPASPAGSKLI